MLDSALPPLAMKFALALDFNGISARPLGDAAATQSGLYVIGGRLLKGEGAGRVDIDAAALEYDGFAGCDYLACSR